MASSKSQDPSKPEEFSTTLRIGLLERIFYLTCHQHERFKIGSSDDCKLAIDGEGIANEHCEIERVDETHFIIRALGIASVDVTYQEHPHGVAMPARVSLRKGGVSPSEVYLLSPFGIEFGTVKLSIAVVPDSEAEGYEEVMVNRDNIPIPYVVSQRRKKKPVRDSAAHTGTQRLKAEPALTPVDQALAHAGSVPARDASAISENAAAPSLDEPVVKTELSRAEFVLPDNAIPAQRHVNSMVVVNDGASEDNTAPFAPLSGAYSIPPLAHSRQTAPTPPKSVGGRSPKRLLCGLLSFCLLAALGYGWFTWRKPNSLTGPLELHKKVEAGDSAAMATLGLSMVRGERGSSLDLKEGIRLVEASAQSGDPFGHLALGWLQSEGYTALTPGPADAKPEGGNLEWRKAFELGLEEKATQSDDPRWWSLTCLASKALQGNLSGKFQALLEKASKRKEPEAALLLAENAATSLIRNQWLQRLDVIARSGNSGSVFARRLLGELHAFQDFEKADSEFGMVQLEGAADGGDPIAQLHLADILDGQKKPEIAFQRTRQAAETGFIPAKTALAKRYLHGLGTDAQPYLAVTLANEAVALGDAKAVVVLASAYAEGKGVEPDLDLAIELLQDLPDREDLEASVELSKLLDKAGRGSEGIAPLRLAAEAGDREAALTLGRQLIKSKAGGDQEEAARWLEKVAAQESGDAISVDAITELVEHLDSSDRVLRNPERVVQLLQPRVEAGDHKSALRMCEYLITGRAMAADPVKALTLAKAAAAAGESLAFFQLGELYEKGAGTQKPDPAAALREYQKALAAGDERIFERFPGLIESKQVATDFVASWELPSSSDTTAYLADGVESYFFLKKPDAALIESLESGLRQLWPDRLVVVHPAQNVTLEGLDHIRLSLPYEFLFSLNDWLVEGEASALVDLRQQAGGSWKIFSYEETVQKWKSLEPKRENFELGKSELANSRSVFPVTLPEDVSYDVGKLPTSQVLRAKTLPFSDKFGNRSALVPISVMEDIVVFSRVSAGGEISLPSAHFDAETLALFSDMVDAQSADVYEGFAAQLLGNPDSRDPKTASLLASANREDHESEALVGESYYDGLGGFPVNRVEALKWFLKSARGENPLGRLWIALMVEKDGIQVSGSAHDFYNEAIPLLIPLIARPGAKGNHLRAYVECWSGLHNLSLHAPEQRELLERAITAGDLRAKLLLGDSLLRSDNIEGIGYLKDARDGGCATAGKILAKYYLGRGNDPRLAPALLRTAAKKHDPEAQILLSERLAKTDPVEAALWLQLGLQNAVQLVDKTCEAQAREAILAAKSTIGEDKLRRAEKFLKDKNIRLGE